MVNLYFLIIGIVIIALSIAFIKSKSSKNGKYEEYENYDEYEDKNKDIVVSLESIENIIDDINVTFNDTIDQIERKYSVLESKLEKVELETSKKQKTDIESIDINTYDTKEMNYENYKVENAIEDESVSINIKAAKVKELIDKGMSTTQIAKTLNIGVGEVSLIINLRKE